MKKFLAVLGLLVAAVAYAVGPVDIGGWTTDGPLNVTGTMTATSVAGDGSSLTGLTASQVNLGNVTNESKATMFTSPTFTGTTKLSVQENTTDTGCSSGGTVCSGTWTPTTADGSCTSGGSVWSNVDEWQWIRVGNVVRFSGRATIDCDTGSSVLIDLPVASNFTAAEDVSGQATSPTEAMAFCRADSTNDQVEVFISGNPNDKIYLFDISYRVL